MDRRISRATSGGSAMASSGFCGSPRVRFARSVFASVLISTTSSGSTPIPTSRPPGPSVGLTPILSHESMPTESRYGLPVNRRSRAILERIEVVRAELRARIAHVYPARRRPARPMASAMPGSSANVFGKSRVLMAVQLLINTSAGPSCIPSWSSNLSPD
jgi:hypothetical protein